MAIDKDPSIYRDRGTIGSSDELDEYGVWVKSEPQVLRAPSPSSAEEIEPALPDIEDLPDLDLELTEDAVAPDMPEIVMERPDELVPDFSDLPSFSMEENQAEESPAPADEGFTELSVDDFLDSSDSTGFVESEAFEPEHKAEEPFEDIELEFSDEKASEAAPSSDNSALEPVTEFDDFLNELSDQSSPTPPPVAAEVLDGMPELDIDLDLQEEEPTMPMTDNEISVNLSASDGAVEADQGEVQGDSHFDDVGALGKELSEAPSFSAGKLDLSTELLMRIADELASIKTEISSLKGELSVLRSASKAEPSDIAAPLPEVKEESAAKGFFDEEDDETIALTGDELDNILNTADFTEEAGSDAGEGLSLDSEAETGMDFLSDKPDILGENESELAAVVAEEPIVEEPAADEAAADDFISDIPTIDDIVGLKEEESSIESISIEEEVAEDEPLELAELRESGVRPMTPAPEDTSYLEEEQIEIPMVDAEEHLDLTEAVIEEPDLGDFSLEEPQIEEPSIESIDIDLDLVENLQAEEIVLPVEAKEESFEEVIPEGFVVEAEGDSVELEPESSFEEIAEESLAIEEEKAVESTALPQNLREEVRSVLSYMDQLLESLPESKIEEFARSEYFDTYKKLFEELGIA